MDNGSSNLSGSTADKSATINCMLRGADYEKAIQTAKSVSAGTAVDGAYYVVVFVTDEGGNESEAGEFEVNPA